MENFEIQNPHTEFQPGTDVIYGLHGRCSISGVETKNINGENILFYKLTPVKNAISRSKKQEPSIWLRVSLAKERGLRTPIQKGETERVFSILGDREYYFSLEEKFSKIQPELEKAIHQEGSVGLAKVLSYLFVLSEKMIVPPPEVSKFFENIKKLLAREIAEATQESISGTEEKLLKMMQIKLQPDS